METHPPSLRRAEHDGRESDGGGSSLRDEGASGPTWVEAKRTGILPGLLATHRKTTVPVQLGSHDGSLPPALSQPPNFLQTALSRNHTR